MLLSSDYAFFILTPHRNLPSPSNRHRADHKSRRIQTNSHNKRPFIASALIIKQADGRKTERPDQAVSHHHQRPDGRIVSASQNRPCDERTLHGIHAASKSDNQGRRNAKYGPLYAQNHTSISKQDTERPIGKSRFRPKFIVDHAEHHAAYDTADAHAHGRPGAEGYALTDLHCRKRRYVLLYAASHAVAHAGKPHDIKHRPAHRLLFGQSPF